MPNDIDGIGEYLPVVQARRQVVAALQQALNCGSRASSLWGRAPQGVYNDRIGFRPCRGGPGHRCRRRWPGFRVRLQCAGVGCT